MNGLILILIFYSQPISAEPEKSTKQESEAAERPGLIFPTLTPRPTTTTTTTTTTPKTTNPETIVYFFIAIAGIFS